MPNDEREETQARPARAPAEPEPTYSRAEILGAAASYDSTPAHLGAALALLGRPERATRKDVEAALERLRNGEGL